MSGGTLVRYGGGYRCFVTEKCLGDGDGDDNDDGDDDGDGDGDGDI